MSSTSGSCPRSRGIEGILAVSLWIARSLENNDGRARTT